MMKSPNSLLSKCFQGTTPFCIDLDEENSYVVEVPDDKDTD